MRKINYFVICTIFGISGLWAELDCPADSAVHVDTRTMLPDGSPNQTYGQELTQVSVDVLVLLMVPLLMAMRLPLP